MMPIPSALGVTALVAGSYGAIYERNAINAGLPVLAGDLLEAGLENGQEITLDLTTGEVTRDGGGAKVAPASRVQLEIYQRGGLLA